MSIFYPVLSSEETSVLCWPRPVEGLQYARIHMYGTQEFLYPWNCDWLHKREVDEEGIEINKLNSWNNT